MKVLKVLNNYAGLGGNRQLWENVEVTAIEKDPIIAEIYKSHFPDDEVIVCDGHKYLLENFSRFGFVWSSPPCQTNSRIFEAGIKAKRYSKKIKLKYHDLSLYQEVLLLSRYFKGEFVVENVEPFYTPLIPAEKVNRHLFWANFKIGKFTPGNEKNSHQKSEFKYLEKFFGYDLEKHFPDKIDRRQVLRNCVNPELGNHVLNRARGIITKSKTKQFEIEL